MFYNKYIIFLFTYIMKLLFIELHVSQIKFDIYIKYIAFLN